MLKKSKLGKSRFMLLAMITTLAVVLSACGSGNNKGNNASSPSQSASAPESQPASASESPSESASASPAPSAEALSEYQLKVVWEGPPQKDEAAVEAKINEYLKEKINATVDLAPIDWGPWAEKMNLMIASRETMDVVFTAQWNGHANNVSKGAYLALNDPNGPAGNLLEKYGEGISSSLDPAFLEGAKINGLNYGIPTNKELAFQAGIIYRKDIADELGITEQLEAVTTVAELEPLLKIVKEKKPNITPLFLRDGEHFNSHYFAQHDYLGDAQVNGLVLKSGEPKVISRFEDQAYIDQLAVTRKLFQAGLINKDAATTQLGVQDSMKKGNVFMIPAPLKPGKDAEFAIATGLEGKLKQINIGPRTISTGETTGAMLAVSSTSKDPARAMMFINMLHSDKYLNNLINFGIEGEHYVKVSDNVIKAGPKAADYNPGVAWELGNQFLNPTFESEAADKWEQFKKFNEGAVKSPALGFTFNVEPVKSQAAILNNIRSQYAAAIETGSVDPKKVDDWLAKEKANGLDDVIAEKQKQLDAFLASK